MEKVFEDGSRIEAEWAKDEPHGIGMQEDEPRRVDWSHALAFPEREREGK